MTELTITTDPCAHLNEHTVITQGELVSAALFCETSRIIRSLLHALRSSANPDEVLAELQREGVVTVEHDEFYALVSPDAVFFHVAPSACDWRRWFALLQELATATGSTVHVTMSDGVYVLGLYTPHLDTWFVRKGFHFTLDTDVDTKGFPSDENPR